jgi:phenylalanyl-tRNA synthetase beta chain
MNVSYRWLKALAPGIQGSAEEIAHRLALLGAPVDELTDLGAGIGDVVIARVEEVRPHPNADRLRVTRVNAGGELVQVVCGAPNVEAGGLYPFAPVGATLPGGINIGKAKLRGEVSEGMLCSARELGLGRDHAGLMTLHGDFAPGTRFVDALGLDDFRLLIDVTPNRGELLSHVGVARELAPGGEAGVELPVFPNARKVRMNTRAGRLQCDAGGVSVRIEDEAGCPRYMGALVRGVRVAPSPEWLATRLRAVGLRPINNIVDATNYVLFELGQPLHAFDLAKLRGGEVVIRRAHEGESLTTLDGTDRALLAGDLVIADAEGAVAIAGVMGGANSEVDDATTDIFIECALFEPKSVRRTRSRLVLSTDASYRFERGVDPEGQPVALQRVVELIVAVAGGEAAEAVDLNPHPWERRAIALRPERVKRVLGTSVQPPEIKTLLEEIGFEVNASWPLRVLVPGFRGDVEEEIDLIEEIARRRGYDSFPDELAPFRPSTVPEAPVVEVERRFAERFAAWGFLEARTTGFVPESAGEVRVLNPLSAEEGFLRSALVPGLLRRVEHNFAHGVRDVRLFEIGSAFSAVADGGMPREERRIAAAFSGAALDGRGRRLRGVGPQGDAGGAGARVPRRARGRARRRVHGRGAGRQPGHGRAGRGRGCARVGRSGVDAGASASRVRGGSQVDPLRAPAHAAGVRARPGVAGAARGLGRAGGRHHRGRRVRAAGGAGSLRPVRREGAAGGDAQRGVAPPLPRGGPHADRRRGGCGGGAGAARPGGAPRCQTPLRLRKQARRRGGGWSAPPTPPRRPSPNGAAAPPRRRPKSGGCGASWSW